MSAHSCIIEKNRRPLSWLIGVAYLASFLQGSLICSPIYAEKYYTGENQMYRVIKRADRGEASKWLVAGRGAHFGRHFAEVFRAILT